MRYTPPLIALAFIWMAGCDPTSPTIPDLGDAYVVEMSPDPLLDGDVLRVAVSYSGGCEDHTFELGFSTANPEPELWLKHDANGDLCEAYITDTLAIPVPLEALQGRPIRLYIGESETISLMESLR